MIGKAYKLSAYCKVSFWWNLLSHLNYILQTLDGERSYQNFRNGRKVHAPLAVLVNRSNTSSLSGSLTTMQYVSDAIKGNKSNVEQVLTTLENSLDLSENLCQKAILTQILDHSGKPNVRRSWDSSSNKVTFSKYELCSNYFTTLRKI